MSLAPLDRIGPYEVTGTLGRGGMGEVYRARDSRLNRDVAVKVLPAALDRDPERLARFTREAQILAGMNHSNIAMLFGLDSGGGRALVMELVEGPTFADRIQQGAIRRSGASRSPDCRSV
jgi:serine/threonine protein kinase